MLACSALRRSYRAELVPDRGRVRLVYLRVDRATLARRLLARRDHFLPAALLDSQLETLEEPAPDEALVLDGDRPPAELVAEIRRGTAAAGPAS